MTNFVYNSNNYADSPYNPDMSEEIHLEPPQTFGHKKVFMERRFFIAIIIFISVVFFILGIIIGVACASGSNEVPLSSTKKTLWPSAQEIVKKFDTLQNNINPNDIKNYLYKLTKVTHMAGTDNSNKVAKDLNEFYGNLKGFKSKLVNYTVLLSYPKIAKGKYVPSTLTLSIDSNVNFTYEAPKEPIPAFNGFSKNGNATAKSFIYANYGRREDFEKLDDALVKNSIVIVRYGKIFRANKVKFAQEKGALGVLIYNDPYDFGPPDGFPNTYVYPNSTYLPKDGVQRGTMYYGNGDPLTQGYPSKDYVYRAKPKDIEPLVPEIPAFPVSYDIAGRLLNTLTGGTEDASWKGKINAVNYNINAKSPSNVELKMNVQVEMVEKTISNVIAMLPGSVEPDRYVILGNHHDAWLYGGLDPSSGTAAQQAIAKVVSDAYASGKWKPKRTLIFCQWDAEEYGLIGSTEWVEDFIKVLGNRALVYLNMDIAVEGNYTFRAKSSLGLNSILYEATKAVSNPNKTEVNAGRTSVYDTWLFIQQMHDSTLKVPTLKFLGSGSDYAPFAYQIGIPSIDFRYENDANLFKVAYPMYHTKYETFKLTSTLVDPTFEFHKAVAAVVLRVAMSFADSKTIPFSVPDFGKRLARLFQEFKEANDDQLKSEDYVQYYKALEDTVGKFIKKANAFQAKPCDTPLQQRALNDQLMQLERAFIWPQGLPGYPLRRNVLASPSTSDSYSGSVFPGIINALYAKDKKQIQQQLSLATVIVDGAISTLDSVTNF